VAYPTSVMLPSARPGAMEPTRREEDKLLIFTTALLAERRMARGVKATGGVTLTLSFEDRQR
jgi:hypothetical protein